MRQLRSASCWGPRQGYDARDLSPNRLSTRARPKGRSSPQMRSSEAIYKYRDQRPGPRRGGLDLHGQRAVRLRWKVRPLGTRRRRRPPCRGSRPFACGVHLPLTGKQPAAVTLKACLMTSRPRPTPMPLPARPARATAVAATRPTSLGRALRPGRRRCPPTLDLPADRPARLAATAL